MIAMVIHTGPHAGRRVHLREMRGRDELSAAEGDVLELLRDLLVTKGGDDLDADELEALTVSDRDRLLVALYQEAFGDALTCRYRCTSCHEPFEIELSIRDLSERVMTGRSDRCSRGATGEYTSPAGTRFRLPTLADQRVLRGLPPERVLQGLHDRCIEHAASEDDVDELMAEAGPLLDLELSASCPDCDADQDVPFEISQFFCLSMSRERRWLTREVHRLATAYGWSLPQILELPRSLRREYVALIEAEGGTRRRYA